MISLMGGPSRRRSLNVRPLCIAEPPPLSAEAEKGEPHCRQHSVPRWPVAALASSTVTPYYSVPAQHAAIAIAPGGFTRLLVESAKRIHDFIEPDRPATIWHAAQRGS